MPTSSHPPQLQEYLSLHPTSSVRLHLGCGGQIISGFLNVDLHPSEENEVDSSRDGCSPDCIGDMTKLGLADNTVDEIFTSHTIDHFTRWTAIAMLRDWHRMLKPGSKCIIEVADFWRCVLWLFHPLKSKRQLARTQFYGNQWDEIEYETHRYVWSSSELNSVLLEQVGFSSVAISHKTTTHIPGRDMRVIATK